MKFRKSWLKELKRHRSDTVAAMHGLSRIQSDGQLENNHQEDNDG